MSTIITLDNILKNDDTTINNIKYQLKKKGWCFLKFSDIFNMTIKKIVTHTDNFFKSALSLKNKYRYNYNVGYNELLFKHHLKLLTCDYDLPNITADFADTSIEINMKRSLQLLKKIMDKLMINITAIFSDKIFNLTKKQEECLSIFGENKVGLLDIVKYKSNIDIQKNPYYVTEHVDPGLFSLNVFSDSSGMQFYDPTLNKWFELKHGYGVIFCGQAAKTFSDFPAAKHRVLNNGIGRLSIWYEVGLKNQVPLKNNIKNIENKIENKTEDKIKITVEFESGYSTRIYNISASGTIFDIKKAIEEDQGPPSSKTVYKTPSNIKIDDKFKKNLDDCKIGNIKNWKITSSGFLIENNNKTPPPYDSGIMLINNFNKKPQESKYYKSTSNYYLNSFR